MSSRQTTNLGLHAWEASDAFRRTEFNDNFERIDKAVGEKADAETVTGLQTALDAKADADTVNAALAVRPELVFGTYEGNGEASRTIELGFKPKAVLLFSSWGATALTGIYYGGLALPGYPVEGTNSSFTTFSITDNGFQVRQTSDSVRANGSGVRYHYIAFK